MEACDESSADEGQSSVHSSDEDLDEDLEIVTTSFAERCRYVKSGSFDEALTRSEAVQQSCVEIFTENLLLEDSITCYSNQSQLNEESPRSSIAELAGLSTQKRRFKGTSKDMSERERSQRNKNSKVERACSNAAHNNSTAGSQSRNHLHQHHRHESEAKNRPREKSQTSSRNYSSTNFEKKSDYMTVPSAAASNVSEKMTVDEAACKEDDDLDSSLKNDASDVCDITVINSFPPTPVVYNWQATKSTVKERLGFMFCNELMADVYFIVGKNGPRQRIPAHRFVLSIGSAVFDAMFNGGMATDEEEIELPDIEPAAFFCLLKFFYSDEVKIGPDTVMASLYAAKKYAVPALEHGCVDYLKKHLSSDNAFMLLMQARLFDEPHLAAMCLEMIDKTTSEALVADGFTDIDLDTLCIVLERDTLGIKECKLFAAVTRWAEAECNRQSLPATPENLRRVLGRALNLIRFPLMTVEEFAVGAAQSGILTDRETVELFLYFTVSPRPHVNFSDVLRCCLTGKEQVVSRFCEIENRWGYSGTSDRIRFMVSRKIFIVGFGLYGSIQSPAEYTVNIQILHTDTCHVCGVNDTSFLSDGSTSTFRVMFKEPVEILPNTCYTASATLKGPDSYYGAKGLRKVTHESITSGKVIFQFTYAAGNNNGTSVEDGQIPEIVFYTSDPIG